MIGALRVALGAVTGAALAGVALRARRLAHERDASLVDVLGELPAALADDAQRVRRAADGAVRDGMRAARQAEEDVDKVLRVSRRTRGTHERV